MVEILIALIAIGALSAWVITKANNMFCEFLSIMGFVVAFFGLIAYCALAFDYFASGHKAQIINREFNTNYTQIEVFYAADVIDTIREIKRQRIEVKAEIN
jgi:hypothetical protein